MSENIEKKNEAIAAEEAVEKEQAAVATESEAPAAEAVEASAEEPKKAKAKKAADEPTEEAPEEAAAPEKAPAEESPKEKTLTLDSTPDAEDARTVAVSRETAAKRSRSAISEFASHEERVLGSDGQEKQSAKVEEFSETLINLSMSLRSHRILRGFLASVERHGQGVVGVVWYGDFKIFIEASNLLGPTYNRFYDMSDAESLSYALSGRLGSEVSYIVTAIEPEGKCATGDHQMAARAFRRRFYLRDDNTGRPPVREGRIVEAKVLSARRFGVILDILGFEKRVPLNDLTYARLEHGGQEFHPGDSVEVRIKEIVIEDGDVKDVVVSATDVKSNPYRRAIEALSTHASYTGTVRRIDERAVFVGLNVSDTEVTCYCQYPRFAVKLDSEVVVQIDGKESNGTRVWGRLIRTIRY